MRPDCQKRWCSAKAIPKCRDEPFLNHRRRPHTSVMARKSHRQRWYSSDSLCRPHGIYNGVTLKSHASARIFDILWCRRSQGGRIHNYRRRWCSSVVAWMGRKRRWCSFFGLRRPRSHFGEEPARLTLHQTTTQNIENFQENAMYRIQA